MMNDHIVNVTNTTFEEIVLQNKKPVLVDFWAEWCGPCKMFAPILEEVFQEYKNNLLVTKVNVDDYPNIALTYSVRSVPTILFFNNQKLIFTKAGMMSKLEIKKFLNLHFNIK